MRQFGFGLPVYDLAHAIVAKKDLCFHLPSFNEKVYLCTCFLK